MTSHRYKETFDAPLGLDGRVLRDEYKRVSQQEEQSVYDTNAAQIMEKRRREAQEREEATDEASSMLQATAVLGAVELEERKNVIERRRVMDAENRAIAQAQRSLKEQSRQLYANS